MESKMPFEVRQPVLKSGSTTKGIVGRLVLVTPDEGDDERLCVELTSPFGEVDYFPLQGTPTWLQLDGHFRVEGWKR